MPIIFAASVSLGVHGRRRTGTGESFWRSSAATSPRTRSPPSTGANRPSRNICLCASAQMGRGTDRHGYGRDGGANMDSTSGPEKSGIA